MKKQVFFLMIILYVSVVETQEQKIKKKKSGVIKQEIAQTIEVTLHSLSNLIEHSAQLQRQLFNEMHQLAEPNPDHFYASALPIPLQKRHDTLVEYSKKLQECCKTINEMQKFLK